MNTAKAKSVIVIGAGIGGIATAVHLAQRGRHVTVVEKNARPGGRCDRFSRDGHQFDAGPTLFVMPLVYEAEFAALGASLHEMLICSALTRPTISTLTTAATWRSPQT